MDATAELTEARITVERTSTDDVQTRQIVVKVDGATVGELMYGHSMTIPVKAGRHQLVVDNTWNRKKIDVDVAEGEDVKFQTVNRAGRFTWFLVGTLGVGPIYVSVQRENAKQSQPPAD
jgi:hypothetical protein